MNPLLRAGSAPPYRNYDRKISGKNPNIHLILKVIIFRNPEFGNSAILTPGQGVSAKVQVVCNANGAVGLEYLDNEAGEEVYMTLVGEAGMIAA